MTADPKFGQAIDSAIDALYTTRHQKLLGAAALEPKLYVTNGCTQIQTSDTLDFDSKCKCARERVYLRSPLLGLGRTNGAYKRFRLQQFDHSEVISRQWSRWGPRAYYGEAKNKTEADSETPESLIERMLQYGKAWLALGIGHSCGRE